MVKNSLELAIISQEWADKAKNSIAVCLRNFMNTNGISFDTLCQIMPIEEDILEDILTGESNMITMDELSAIMICMDLVAEIKPSSETPIQFGSGDEDENIITEAQKIESDKKKNEKIGCGVIVSDDPNLQKALETLVNMFEKDPESVNAFINLFGKI